MKKKVPYLSSFSVCSTLLMHVHDFQAPRSSEVKKGICFSTFKITVFSQHLSHLWNRTVRILVLSWLF